MALNGGIHWYRSHGELFVCMVKASSMPFFTSPPFFTKMTASLVEIGDIPPMRARPSECVACCPAKVAGIFAPAKRQRDLREGFQKRLSYRIMQCLVVKEAAPFFPLRGNLFRRTETIQAKWVNPAHSGKK